MDLLTEIKENLAFLPKEKYGNYGRQLHSVTADYPAYTIRLYPRYGVAIPCPDSLTISEDFANCKLHTELFSSPPMTGNFLVLDCQSEEYRNNFAWFCQHFIDPGKDGELRKAMLTNPLKWWESWKDLMGNAIMNRNPYSTIAEMDMYFRIRDTEPSAIWTGGFFGTHDIETEDAGYEVKASLKKYDTKITVSSQFQLKPGKDLNLYFYRMEKSEQGISINDMLERLVTAGCDRDKLEQQLMKLGFEKGASVRAERYKILEWRHYKVDEHFPAITAASFKGDTIPKNITKIVYTIDLEGLDCVDQYSSHVQSQS